MTGVPSNPPPTQPAARIGWIDTGRGIAILLVALYHSASWLLGAGFDIPYWREINDALSSMRMPLFFALAGLFAPKWLAVPWNHLWNSKLRLYVWVFLIWEVIGSVVFMLGLSLRGQGVGVRQSLLALLVSPVAPRFELWFIWALALFFVAAKLARRVDYRVQLALTGVVSMVALSGWETANVGWSGSARHLFFFLAGLYLRPVILRLGSIPPTLAAGVVALWAVLSTTVAVFDLRTVPGLYFANCLIGVVAGVSISRVLAGVPRLASIGRTTLPIYLAHTPLIILLSFVLSTPLLFPVLAPVAGGVPPVLAAIAVALALWLNRAAAPTPLRYLYQPPPTVLRIGDRSTARAGRRRAPRHAQEPQ
ncbi:acyltransferase family protein [Cryobacterium arcticum]|uniref:acyltransferase family protein n=1 Tax=Cryobacterium arcticum TaxID=670052 RepID=UPI0015E8648B|nr:acyltransferase family protein [Cryobacterium arcticum]